jgi:aldose 1-epimerase
VGEIVLTAGPCRLVLEPERGGSVSRFERGRRPIFRPTCGPSPFDTACFPLVPFSNRIAHGRFYDGDRAVQLAPNFPAADHPHTIHGFSWLSAWEVVDQQAASAVLRHAYAASEWPWPYVAEQRFTLGEHGLLHEIAVTNLGETAMPAGLGLHPYFPRDAATLYHGLHTAEWQTAADGLPLSRTAVPEPIDWWEGNPVERRDVDTVYTGRAGPLTILWATDGVRLTIEPSDTLPFTVVYTPPDRDFFWVEPVSHATDAINMRTGDSGLRWLAPGQRFEASVRYEIEDYRPYPRIRY